MERHYLFWYEKKYFGVVIRFVYGQDPHIYCKKKKQIGCETVFACNHFAWSNIN